MAFVRSIPRQFRDLVGGFFEETRITRTIVLAESVSGFDIPTPREIGDRHFRDIHAPGVVTGSNPVIFLRTTNTGRSRFTARLNQHRLIDHEFRQSGTQSWHRLIPAGGLKEERNELVLDVRGEGSVRFSDILILYTANNTKVRVPSLLQVPSVEQL
jgi:hypothetical protein